MNETQTTENMAPEDFNLLFKKNETLAEFKKSLVPHRIFVDCEREILRRVAQPGVANILSVVGPTGAGKTQLLNEVANVLLGLPAPDSSDFISKLTELETQPHLPVVYVTASTGRSFESRFRGLLVEILRSLNAPLITAQAIRSKPGASHRPPSQALEKVSIPRMEEMVRTFLKERQVRALLIDEAQHLAQGSGKDEWRLVGDGLKLLGSVSGTLVVLFGTSELLGLPYLSGQLGRRTRALHLRRYLWTDADDLEEFKGIVASFSGAFPKALPMELMMENLQLVYTGCLGCVGILSSWLYDAVARAEQLGQGTVSLEVLKQTAFSEIRLRRIHTEAQECERSFINEGVGLDNLIGELCGRVQPPVSLAQKLIKATRKKFKPGNRNPTYDTYKPETCGATA